MIEIKSLDGRLLAQVEKLAGADLRSANLRGADLRGADLYGADLYGANLRGANLRGANLRGADLYGADMRRANLRGADMRGADMRSANLSGADLSGADMRGADMRSAYLRCANLTDAKLPHFQICPERGAFIAWKKTDRGVIRIRIPKDAQRTSSLVGRKCRASHVIVLGGPGVGGTGPNRRGLVYTKGATVHADKFDPDIRVGCTHGIHFWLTRAEAEEWV